MADGTLEPWNPGTLEPWNFGTLKPLTIIIKMSILRYLITFLITNYGNQQSNHSNWQHGL